MASENCIHGCAIDGLAFERAVQVDNVKMREALAFEQTRLGGRVCR